MFSSVVFAHPSSPATICWFCPFPSLKQKALDVISIKRVEFTTREKIPKKILDAFDDSLVSFVKDNNKSYLFFLRDTQLKHDLVSSVKLLQAKFLQEKTAAKYSQSLILTPLGFSDNKQAFIEQIWSKLAPEKEKQEVSLLEIEKVLAETNLGVNHEAIKRKFQELDMENKGRIAKENMGPLFESFQAKDEFLGVFQSYSYQAVNNAGFKKDQKTMSILELQKFWEIEQKEHKSLKELQWMVSRQNTPESISFIEFSYLICSHENSVINPKMAETTYQDMTRPLHEYFVFSSHNTYALGHQLGGESSPEGYIRAIEKGCRCFELDCWDGPQEEPVVTHGHTLMSKCTFLDCVASIVKHGFRHSLYPLILTLEMHCKKTQQARIATILKDLVGSQLYLLPENFEDFPELPSPEELKGKVLIRSGSGDVISIMASRENRMRQVQQEPLIIPSQVKSSYRDEPCENEKREEEAIEFPSATNERLETRDRNFEIVLTRYSSELKNWEKNFKNYFSNEEDSSTPKKAQNDSIHREESRKLKEQSHEDINKEAPAHSDSLGESSLIEKNQQTPFENSPHGNNEEKSPDFFQIVQTKKKESGFSCFSSENIEGKKEANKLSGTDFENGPELLKELLKESPLFKIVKSKVDFIEKEEMKELFGKWGENIEKKIQKRRSKGIKTGIWPRFSPAVLRGRLNKNLESDLSFSKMLSESQNSDVSSCLKGKKEEERSTKTKERKPAGVPAKKKKMEASLNSLLSLFGYSLRENLGLNLFWNVSSLSETAGMKLLNKQALGMTGYTVAFLLRVYPRGTRFDSSNYDPMPFLSSGAQMVALNLQTNDINQGFLIGKFIDNGRCGYVLKPEFMRNPMNIYNPFSKPQGREKQPLVFSMTLMSGIQLTEEIQNNGQWDPTVTFSLKGASIDESSNKAFSSKHPNGTPFHTVWNPSQNTHDFGIFYPETAILFVEVKLKDSKSSLWNFIPFTMLREGLRTIPLLLRNFIPTKNALLLVKLTKKTKNS